MAFGVGRAHGVSYTTRETLRGENDVKSSSLERADRVIEHTRCENLRGNTGVIGVQARRGGEGK